MSIRAEGCQMETGEGFSCKERRPLVMKTKGSTNVYTVFVANPSPVIRFHRLILHIRDSLGQAHPFGRRGGL